MELKLTTARAIEYEERTGKDLLAFLEEVTRTNCIGVRDTIEIFKSMGEGYNAATFDAWDLPFVDKLKAIMNAVKEYTKGKNQ